ncbi:MAG: TonB C-terminal domain-containing protein [Victivallaceae bacterium]
MAYQSPFRNNTAKTAAQQAATRKKAFYLIVAIAIILISAPVAYMILKGWLGTTEPNADELISDEYYEENVVQETVTEQPPADITAEQTAGNSTVDNNPTATTEVPSEIPAVSTSPQEVVPPATPQQATVTEHDVSQALAAASVPAESGVAAQTPTPVPAPQPTQSTQEPAPAQPTPIANQAQTPGVTPPPPPVPVDVSTHDDSKSVTTTKAQDAEKQNQNTTKRVIRPLSPQELAALKAANDRAAAAKNSASPQERSKYGEKLFSHVRSKWYPPSPQQLNNRKLKAVIELNIASDGKVNSVKFITPSYVKPMDDSVRNLMNNIRKSKAPAPGSAAGTYRIELKN